MCFSIVKFLPILSSLPCHFFKLHIKAIFISFVYKGVQKVSVVCPKTVSERGTVDFLSDTLNGVPKFSYVGMQYCKLSKVMWHSLCTNLGKSSGSGCMMPNLSQFSYN